MDPELIAAEISAALAGTRRRARLLELASGRHSRWQLCFALVMAVAGCVLGWRSIGEVSIDEVSRFTIVLFIMLVVGMGVGFNRLQRRVDALTKLLAEIGYPGEA